MVPQFNSVKELIKLPVAAPSFVWLSESVGFSDVKIFGALDGRDYDNESDRLVVVATK